MSIFDDQQVTGGGSFLARHFVAADPETLQRIPVSVSSTATGISYFTLRSEGGTVVQAIEAIRQIYETRGPCSAFGGRDS